MNASDKREAIELAAAQWLQKRDGEDWTADDEIRCNEWLDADTHHRVAYLRVEAAWREMNRLQALGAGYPRGTVPAPDQLTGRGPLSRRRPQGHARRAMFFGSLAASLVLAITFAVYFSADYFLGTEYSTQTGAVTTVPLKDGTNVVLSTASRIRVQLKEHERHIDLTQGEVFFEVAHDITRPFIVQAGDQRITAVGTKFSVRRDGDDVRVVVTEGKVRMESPEHSAPGAQKALLLTAGTVATSGAAGVHLEQLAPDEAEEQLSWRQGFVVFHETTLADAVAEFNRYNDRKIVIKDPKLAAIQLSGKFRATNIDTLVSLLERTYGIHVIQSSDRIILNSTEE